GPGVHRSRRRSDRVVNRGHTPGAEVRKGASQPVELGRERLHHVQAGVEGEDCGFVLAVAESREEEVTGLAGAGEPLVDVHAAADVEQEREPPRPTVLFGGLNWHRRPVVDQLEILRGQGRDRPSLAVTHDGADRHEIHATAERWLSGDERLRRGRHVGLLLGDWRRHQNRRPEKHRAQRTRTYVPRSAAHFELQLIKVPARRLQDRFVGFSADFLSTSPDGRCWLSKNYMSRRARCNFYAIRRLSPRPGVRDCPPTQRVAVTKITAASPCVEDSLQWPAVRLAAWRAL